MDEPPKESLNVSALLSNLVGASCTEIPHMFVAVMLILIIGSVSLAILYDSGHLTGSNDTAPKILWQNDIEHFASGFAVADGKVFVVADLWLFTYE